MTRASLALILIVGMVAAATVGSLAGRALGFHHILPAAVIGALMGALAPFLAGRLKLPTKQL